MEQEKKISDAINECGLKFENPCLNVSYSISELKWKRIDIPVPKPSVDRIVPMETQRILVYKLKINEGGVLQFDIQDTVKNIASKVRMIPPYLAMKYFKMYIKPKVMF